MDELQAHLEGEGEVDAARTLANFARYGRATQDPVDADDGFRKLSEAIKHCMGEHVKRRMQLLKLLGEQRQELARLEDVKADLRKRAAAVPSLASDTAGPGGSAQAARGALSPANRRRFDAAANQGGPVEDLPVDPFFAEGARLVHADKDVMEVNRKCERLQRKLAELGQLPKFADLDPDMLAVVPEEGYTAFNLLDPLGDAQVDQVAATVGKFVLEFYAHATELIKQLAKKTAEEKRLGLAEFLDWNSRLRANGCVHLLPEIDFAYMSDISERLVVGPGPQNEKVGRKEKQTLSDKYGSAADRRVEIKTYLGRSAPKPLGGGSTSSWSTVEYTGGLSAAHLQLYSGGGVGTDQSTVETEALRGRSVPTQEERKKQIEVSQQKEDPRQQEELRSRRDALIRDMDAQGKEGITRQYETLRADPFDKDRPPHVQEHDRDVIQASGLTLYLSFYVWVGGEQKLVQGRLGDSLFKRMDPELKDAVFQALGDNVAYRHYPLAFKGTTTSAGKEYQLIPRPSARDVAGRDVPDDPDVEPLFNEVANQYQRQRQRDQRATNLKTVAAGSVPRRKPTMAEQRKARREERERAEEAGVAAKKPRQQELDRREREKADQEEWAAREREARAREARAREAREQAGAQDAGGSDGGGSDGDGPGQAWWDEDITSAARVLDEVDPGPLRGPYSGGRRLQRVELLSLE